MQSSMNRRGQSSRHSTGSTAARSNVTAFKRNEQTDFDVIVVGAGLSGIGAAFHCSATARTKSYVILEGRDALGGTWDLFRYPGIRSDSDMNTLGFRFRPWRGEKAIADGPSILTYIHDTARENGIDRKIRYSHKVKRASWSTADARWTLEVERGDGAPSPSPATSCRCAAAITTMTAATCRAGRAWSASRARSCIRRSGPRTSTTRASASW